MELVFLTDRQEALATIASWYFDEWGHLGKGTTMEKVTEDLHSYLNKEQIPLIVLAVEGDEILGAAQLKYREMDIYPEKEHWLGGVFVSSEYRGKKIASKIVIKLLSIAESLNVKSLYLQTENLNGGLYSLLGWQPLEQVNYHGVDVLVMEKRLSV